MNMSMQSTLEIAIYHAYQQESDRWYNLYNEFGIEHMCDSISKRIWRGRPDPSNPDLKKFILKDKHSPLTEADKVYLATYNVG